MTIGTRIAWDGGLGIDTDTSGGEFEPVVVAPPAPLAEARIVAQSIDSVTIDGTDFKPVGNEAAVSQYRLRVKVGGKDVTYFRGATDPATGGSVVSVSVGLTSPFLYGSGEIAFPQIHAAYERPGFGDIAWLSKFAPVVVQLVDTSDDSIVATIYRGFVSDFRHDGHDLTCTLGGEATGRAAMQDRPLPIFPRVSDIGRQVMSEVGGRLRLPKGNQPTTGIELAQSGGGSLLDFLTDRLAMSTEKDGTQWTVMPDDSGKYRMFQKDLTTIAATVYIDGYRVVESLRRDFTEEPNRVWGTGYDSDGMRIRNAVFPGLAFGDPPPFPGTTLNPGDTGDNVITLIRGLWVTSYLNGTLPSAWTIDPDDRVTAAVEDLQDDLDLPVTGTVNKATWQAIFDPSQTGYSVTGAHERPIAQRNYLDQNLYTASGQIRGRNPNFSRSKLPVDVSVSFGRVADRGQARRWARRELAPENVSNWVGTVTVNTGAVIDGTHNPGDPLTTDLVRDARTVKPGDNLWLPNWDGGTLVHVSGVTISPSSVEFAVDTRARDTMKVWEVIARNRESRKSISRQWIAQNRRSGIRDDSGAFYDGGVFGRIGRTPLTANSWNVIATPAGRSGTLQTIDIELEDAVEFGLEIWGAARTSAWLDRKVGDWNDTGFETFFNNHVNHWQDDLWLVDHWGQKDQPCGYGRAAKTGSDGTATGAAATGTFKITSGIPYFCVNEPVLYIAIRPLSATHVKGGRVLKLLLDDAAS